MVSKVCVRRWLLRETIDRSPSNPAMATGGCWMRKSESSESLLKGNIFGAEEGRGDEGEGGKVVEWLVGCGTKDASLGQF